MSKYVDTIPSDIKASISWMLNYIKQNSTLLDVGCSTGYFGEFIKHEKQCTVDGIEISEDKKDAKKRLDNVFSFDVESEWPKSILTKKYDYIFFGDILEHLKKPESVLEKSKKILNNDGLIFVSIPNIAHISTRLEIMRGSFQYEDTGILDNTHLQYFTLATFEKLAKNAGFSIIHVDYSVNDYQKQVVESLLESCGLKPTGKFWEMADSIEARAFQYKLILKPVDSKSKKFMNKFAPLPEKPEHFRSDFIDDLQQQINSINNHAEEQAEIISRQNKIINEQNIEIERINSGFYKLNKTLKRIIIKSKVKLQPSSRKNNKG